MSTDPNIPPDLYRKIAEGVDPVDPDETAASPSFRAAVAAAFVAGRTAAAEDIRVFADARERSAREFPPSSGQAFRQNEVVLKAYRAAAQIAQRGAQNP